MGTASLVFGLILIGSALYFIYEVLKSPISEPVTSDEIVNSLIVLLIFTIPMMAIGGLLLRKYDKDRKKEKRG